MSKDPKSSYYDAGGIETIEVIKAKLTPDEYQGFLKGNAIKYLLRAGHKGDAQRDIEKASTYTNWLLESFNYEDIGNEHDHTQ